DQGPPVRVTSLDARDGSLPGAVIGTPAYMPPEQARGEVRRVDERSDVFSLGGILCEILTGDAPYRGATAAEVQSAARTTALDEASARLDRGGADEDLVGLARRCLSGDKSLRPRDAGVVAKDMAAHLESVEERARESDLAAARAAARA